MIHAYEVTATIDESVDVDSNAFQNAVDESRNRAERAVAVLGGDPLPGQRHPHVDRDRRVVVFTWRSSVVGPDDPRLPGVIRGQAAGLDGATSFVVRYHPCYNGTHRRCPPWRTLFEEDLT